MTKIPRKQIAQSLRAAAVALSGASEQAAMLSEIRPGDRVTIRTPQGQERSGKAVMEGPAGWVLNMGGPHGRPGIASEKNIVKVSKGKGDRSRTYLSGGTAHKSSASAAAEAWVRERILNSEARPMNLTDEEAMARVGTPNAGYLNLVDEMLRGKRVPVAAMKRVMAIGSRWHATNHGWKKTMDMGPRVVQAHRSGDLVFTKADGQKTYLDLRKVTAYQTAKGFYVSWADSPDAIVFYEAKENSTTSASTVSASVPRITPKQYRAFQKAEKGGIGMNDGYNLPTYGISYALFSAIQSAIFSFAGYGSSRDVTNLNEVNRYLAGEKVQLARADDKVIDKVAKALRASVNRVGGSATSAARKPTPKQQKKIDEKRIETAYYKVADNIQINMMDIPKVFKVGEEAIAKGADDAALEKAVGDFVQKIKVSGAAVSANKMPPNDFWQVIDAVRWNGKSEDWDQIKEKIMSLVPKDQAESFENTFNSFAGQAEEEIEKMEFGPLGLALGDDRFNDLVHHIVGLGKRKFFEYIKSPELIRSLDPTESYEYAIPMVEDYD